MKAPVKKKLKKFAGWIAYGSVIMLAWAMFLYLVLWANGTGHPPSS
ncbi:MAG: hypothetical protein IKP91_11860 [Bacteroidaceae bacterium]|nr:hypothetical protein [Bacteroidaceae bacterium]